VSPVLLAVTSRLRREEDTPSSSLVRVDAGIGGHALVTAALEHWNRLRAAELETWLAGTDDTEQRSLVVLDWLRDWYQRDGQRGCGFLNDLTSGPNLLATFMAFPPTQPHSLPAG
jgi:hypothetical protein